MQRVALVHDWLTTWAGAEKALEQLLQLFPEADLYTLVDFLPQVFSINPAKLHFHFAT